MGASREIVVQPLAPVGIYVQSCLFECVVLQDGILGPRNLRRKLAGPCLLQANLRSSCVEYFTRELIPRATALGCSMISTVGGRSTQRHELFGNLRGRRWGNDLIVDDSKFV